MGRMVAESGGSDGRGGRRGLRCICGAVLVLQAVVVALVPSDVRWIVAGLLVVGTFMASTAVVVEASFRRAEARYEQASRCAVRTASAPHERLSSLMRRAYYLARHGAPASFIAGSCDIPEAFAELVVRDVQLAGAKRRGRTKRRRDTSAI